MPGFRLLYTVSCTIQKDAELTRGRVSYDTRNIGALQMPHIWQTAAQRLIVYGMETIMLHRSWKYIVSGMYVVRELTNVSICLLYTRRLRGPGLSHFTPINSNDVTQANKSLN